MERVKKGEKYWFINSFGEVVSTTESGVIDDVKRFEAGNYFHTKEEAGAVAEKIRNVLKGAWVLTPPEGEILSRKVEAVLSGADVIEVPSEEEIKERLNMIIPTQPVEPWCVEGYCKHIIGFIKSKIIK